MFTKRKPCWNCGEAPDAPERCENCKSRRVKHYDVEGVPFCQKCWDDPAIWVSSGPEAQDAKTSP